MARECKAKRDEKRFGKAERLADRLENAEWFPGPWVDMDGEWRLELEYEKSEFLKSAAKATVIVADNISDYVSSSPKQSWDCRTDFPCPVPPMSPLFIEFGVPHIGRDDKDIILARAGWLIQTIPRRILSHPEFASTIDAVPDKEFAGQMRSPEAETFVDSWLIIETKPGHIRGPLFHSGFILDRFGVMLGLPSDSLSGTLKEGLSEHSREQWGDIFGSTIVPAMLSMSFMNCKNVVTTPVEPCRAINRERRKAGLKPFLRYHTINIDPMKRVLKTEGSIETEGLKKALHVCRGHFATYSEDKPLFGHFTGTVWKPSHVRGSAKQGVVVSDYNVKAPRPSSVVAKS